MAPAAHHLFYSVAEAGSILTHHMGTKHGKHRLGSSIRSSESASSISSGNGRSFRNTIYFVGG